MLIRLEHIQRVYLKKAIHTVALEQITLDVSAGEFLAIMGPSGSGKSTLLHILGCLDTPTAGHYWIDGNDVSTCNDTELSIIRNRNIGFIFQAFHLLPQHTVLQNIAVPLVYMASPGASTDSLSPSGPRHRTLASQHPACLLAKQVGLGERLYHRPSELSGGEMQRVAIARALVTNPRVILADEPTGNLDSHTGHEIMRLLQALHQEGHTLIVVTHEQTIADYADRIIFLKDGLIEREEHPVAGRQGSDFDPQPAAPIPQPSVNQSLNFGFHPPVTGFFLTTLPSTVMTAIQGILLHKLRSLLSVLGIVFGISAIIAMLAIGAGARQEILDQIRLLGMTNVTIRAIPSADAATRRGAAQLSQGLTYHDLERLAYGVPHLVALAAVRTFPAQVQYQQRRTQARIVGTEPDYRISANLTLADGRFLTSSDLEEMHRVCVLGADVQQALFAFQNPIGEMVKVRDEWFRVIGVLENKDLHPEKLPSIQIHNVNTDVYIPLSTSPVFVSPQESQTLQEISLQIDTSEHMEQVATIMRSMLDRLHHGAQDYEVVVPRELLQQSQRTQRVFNLVMGSIAGISLLVGGIGIMNIMLATVTERTREIGIRRAIGASRRMILLQFLVETVLLTFAGGMLGILMGIGGAALISGFAGWRTIISWQTVLLAFGISAVIGLLFGMYPASQGANMDPITALRYE